METEIIKMWDLKEIMVDRKLLYGVLENLVRKAVLDSNKKVRNNAIRDIKKYAPFVKRGFIGDNQILLEVENPDDYYNTVVYLCDLPQEYTRNYKFSIKPEVYPFSIKPWYK